MAVPKTNRKQPQQPQQTKETQEDWGEEVKEPDNGNTQQSNDEFTPYDDYKEKQMNNVKVLYNEFDMFDKAANGKKDGIVSSADLDAITKNPDKYDKSIVDAAEKIKEDPALYASLDTASQQSGEGDNQISYDDVKAYAKISDEE